MLTLVLFNMRDQMPNSSPGEIKGKIRRFGQPRPFMANDEPLLALARARTCVA